MNKTTAAIITDLIEGYTEAGARWVRLADIAKAKGLTAAEIAEGVSDLAGDADFRVEADPMGHRVTDADRAYGPMIGGEQCHLIAWS
jgi:hypothetical protein